MSVQATLPLFENAVEIIVSYTICAEAPLHNDKTLTIAHATPDQEGQGFRADGITNEVCDDGLTELTGHRGFIDLHFMKVSSHKASIIVIWETKDCAHSAAEIFGPSWFSKNFKLFLL